ncbi:MAG: hypothetical protein IPF66_11915 [Holophagales bacterium]|nr:hypothetical protein [Holophagales bacterium]
MRASSRRAFVEAIVCRSERDSSLPSGVVLVSSPTNPSPFSTRPRIVLSDLATALTLSTRSPDPARIFSSSLPRMAEISVPGSARGLSDDPGVTSRYLSPRSPIVLISTRLSVRTRWR